MTQNRQSTFTVRVQAGIIGRLHKASLSFALLLAMVAAAGCNKIGKPDARLAGSWSASTTSNLLLKADGTYVMTVKGISPSDFVISNESGKWGVTDDLLNLHNDNAAATTSYRYKLNDRGDQLQLTLISSLNPNNLTVTYQKTLNP